MASEELTLHSQAVRYYNEGSNRVTTGTLFAGDTGSFPGFETASSMRFQLPGDFGGGETVNEAILNIRAFVDDGMGHGDGIKVRLRILADADQSLPATADGIRDAAGGSQQKTIGWGTYSPAIDYVLTTTPTTRAIDLTDAFSEAASAGRLSGGWVVVLMQAMNYGEYVGIQVSGIGTADAPTIDFDYSEGGPPPDPIELTLDETLDDVTLVATVSVAVEASLVESLGDTVLNADVTVAGLPEPREIELDKTLDDVSLAAEAKIPAYYAAMDETLDDVTLDATLAGNIEASLDETLGDVALSAHVATFTTAELDEILDDVDLDSFVGVETFGALNLSEKLDDVSLVAEVITSESYHVSLDETIADVSLESSLLAQQPTVAAANYRLFAGGDLFAGQSDTNFNLFA